MGSSGHVPFHAIDLGRLGIERDVLVEEAHAIAGIELGLGAGAAADGGGQGHIGHLLLHLDIVIAGLVQRQIGAQRHARTSPVRLHADFIVQHLSGSAVRAAIFCAWVLMPPER